MVILFHLVLSSCSNIEVVLVNIFLVWSVIQKFVKFLLVWWVWLYLLICGYVEQHLVALFWSGMLLFLGLPRTYKSCSRGSLYSFFTLLRLFVCLFVALLSLSVVLPEVINWVSYLSIPLLRSLGCVIETSPLGWMMCVVISSASSIIYCSFLFRSVFLFGGGQADCVNFFHKIK